VEQIKNELFFNYNIDDSIPKGMKRISRKAKQGDIIFINHNLSVVNVINIQKLGTFQKLIIKKENGQEDWLLNNEKLFWVLINQ
jgi:ASC-1-like (ASCH) protein